MLETLLSEDGAVWPTLGNISLEDQHYQEQELLNSNKPNNQLNNRPNGNKLMRDTSTGSQLSNTGTLNTNSTLTQHHRYSTMTRATNGPNKKLMSGSLKEQLFK